MIYVFNSPHSPLPPPHLVTDHSGLRTCAFSLQRWTCVRNILYGNFCLTKNKLKRLGTLEDLKAFALTEIDEYTAENTNWWSSSGGIWKFESELLAVTWQIKSMNISLEGENGKDLTERVISYLNEDGVKEHNSVT